MERERNGMEFNGAVPGGEAEERSDEGSPPGTGAPPPDPEVVAKPTRRHFTAEYRGRIVQEAERCAGPGEVGRLIEIARAC